MANRLNLLSNLLSKALPDYKVIVVDESHKHAGHRDAPASGESHYHIQLQGPKVVGTQRIEVHKKINAALSEQFQNGLHAVRVTIRDPVMK
jgi:BolA protein